MHGLRNAGQNPVELLHLRALAENVAHALAGAEPLAQSAAGRIERVPFRQTPQHGAQLFAGKRFDEIVAGSEAQCFER